MGISGLFDPAKNVFDLEANQEDTGQTLAVYGVGPGPFVVLPLLGPFTIRDGVGFVADLVMNPVFIFMPSTPLMGMNLGRAVNSRAQNLDHIEGGEKPSVKEYRAVRTAYFQVRSKAISE